jgi:NDP-sugar pyrophosphorylase family protein
MLKPTLVIMAAGMGSRYGGLKQIDPVGPNGEVIVDYSVYDAMNAGFEKVVFIIKSEIEKDFKAVLGSRIEKNIKTEYVYQRLDLLPHGATLPEGRIKPWGTGHAIMCCKDIVKEPFAVINADDYYGKEAFKLLYDFLTVPQKKDGKLHFCMAGYILENTLTENGHVARGVCKVDESGYLQSIVERTHIEIKDDKTKYTEDGVSYTTIPEGSTVSMNCWGFTPEMISELENRFPAFLENSKDNILKAEYFLPSVVDQLIKGNEADAMVLKTPDKWYGVTYKEDKERVVSAISKLIAQGKYPKRLWKR